MAVLQITVKNAERITTEVWQATFYLEGKRYRKQGFDSKRQAQRWIVDEQIRISKQLDLALNSPANRTVGDFLDDWIDVVEKGLNGKPKLERTTLVDYKSVVQLHLKPIIGTEKLESFTPPHVARAREELLATRSRHIAQRSLKYLRMALNYAVERGYLTVNPAQTVRITAISSREEKQIVIPTREEMRTLLEGVEKIATDKPKQWMRFATMFNLLQGTGMRISEARGLTWDALDLKAGFISIRQRADRFNKIGKVKSRAGLRRVTLDDQVIEALNRWKPLCPASDLKLVFPNGSGNVESYANIFTREWVPLCVGLKLTEETGEGAKYGLHAIRHYRVSELIAHGANIRTIMGQVGHATSAITQDTYGHLFEEDLVQHRDMSNKIAKAVRNQQ